MKRILEVLVSVVMCFFLSNNAFALKELDEILGATKHYDPKLQMPAQKSTSKHKGQLPTGVVLPIEHFKEVMSMCSKSANAHYEVCQEIRMALNAKR